jgi:hypothetical protein
MRRAKRVKLRLEGKEVIPQHDCHSEPSCRNKTDYNLTKGQQTAKATKKGDGLQFQRYQDMALAFQDQTNNCKNNPKTSSKCSVEISDDDMYVGKS